MDKFLQTFTASVGTQLQGMNTTIAKMKGGGEDRYKQINERIANMEKKISVMDEKNENRNDETNRTHDDQKQGKAVATGFHGETSESEVEQLLRETITVPQNPSHMLSPASRITTRGTTMSDQRICGGKS